MVRREACSGEQTGAEEEEEEEEAGMAQAATEEAARSEAAFNEALGRGLRKPEVKKCQSLAASSLGRTAVSPRTKGGHFRLRARQRTRNAAAPRALRPAPAELEARALGVRQSRTPTAAR
jgi:hypothetical protein